MEHSDPDLKILLGLINRTFNDTDLLYFVSFLHHHYTIYDSLEDAFLNGGMFISIEKSLISFEQAFSIILTHLHVPGSMWQLLPATLPASG